MDKKTLSKRAETVTNQAGILPYCEAFYIHSIIYSAGQCINAFNQYDNAALDDVTADNLIGAVQTAVGHATALSRYFWPAGANNKRQPALAKLRKSRGKRLRAAFEITDNSPLYSRSLRNAWEHFDEKLDEFLLIDEAGYFSPSALIDSHTLADGPTGHVFKLLDPQTECLVLLNEKYFFGPIRAEVDRIQSIAMAANREGARLPRVCRD